MKLISLPVVLAIASLASLPCAAQDAPEDTLPDYEASLRCAFLMTAAIVSREAGSTPDRSAGDALTRYITHAERLSGKSTEQVIDDMGTSAGILIDELAGSPDPVASRDEAIAACRAGAADLPAVDRSER